MKLLIFYFLLFFTFTFTVFTQEKKDHRFDDDNDFFFSQDSIIPKNNRIGLQISMLNGIFPYYSVFITNDISILAGFYCAGTTDDFDANKNDFILNLGANVKYTIANFSPSRMYIVPGFCYQEIQNYHWQDFNYDYLESNNTKKYTYSLGLGYEVYIIQNITFSLDVGYFYTKTKNIELLDKSLNSNKDKYGFGLGVTVNYSF